jgi:hypothetical protein
MTFVIIFALRLHWETSLTVTSQHFGSDIPSAPDATLYYAAMLDLHKLTSALFCTLMSWLHCLQRIVDVHPPATI